MSQSNPPQGPDRVEKFVAFLIASVTVLIAIVTFLQTYASGESNEADRTSTRYAIQAIQVKTSGETRVSHEWEGAYQIWYELNLQALGADLAGDTAGAQRYRTVRDHILKLSPLLSSSQYFDPNSDNLPDSSGYQADTYLVESTRLEEKFQAYNEIGDAWDNRSNAFIAHLTLLAVSLSLFGLSATMAGKMRGIFIALGSIIAALVAAWAAFIMLTPLPALPDAAINAYSEGVGLAWRGDYRGAVQKFDAALAEKPDYANAFYDRGNAYFSLGDYPSAAANYEAALQVGRADTNVGWNLGWTYYLLGRFDDAIQMDRATLSRDPSLIAVRFNLALVLMANGQFAEARSEYENGISQAVHEVVAAHQEGKQPPSSFWYYLDASATDIDNLLLEMNGNPKPWSQAPARGSIVTDPVKLRALAGEMFYQLKDTTVSLEFTGKAPPQTQRPTASAFQFAQEEFDDQGNFTKYDIATTFAYGINSMQVLFDYNGMTPGASEIWKVYRNGSEDPTLRVVNTWGLQESGSAAKPISYAYSNLFVFRSGEYTVELYIDSHLIGRGTFTVEEQK